MTGIKKLVKETAEVSNNKNKLLEDLVHNGGLSFLAFEGYTLKGDKVSALLERRRSSVNPDEWGEKELLEELISSETPEVWNAKIKCSRTMGVPFYFVVYTDLSERVLVYNVDAESLSLAYKFDRYKDFATWNMSMRSMKMASRFEEANLPIFDQKLRELGTPWPGNFDCIWYDAKNGKILAIIEFSMTKKYTVKEHCHNRFFSSSQYRKGDEQRWLALDIPRIQLACPLIIIVWSPSEDDVKIKIVDHIEYKGTDAGLHYKEKSVLKSAEVLAKLKSIVGLE